MTSWPIVVPVIAMTTKQIGNTAMTTEDQEGLTAIIAVKGGLIVREDLLRITIAANVVASPVSAVANGTVRDIRGSMRETTAATGMTVPAITDHGAIAASRIGEIIAPVTAGPGTANSRSDRTIHAVTGTVPAGRMLGISTASTTPGRVRHGTTTTVDRAVVERNPSRGGRAPMANPVRWEHCVARLISSGTRSSSCVKK